LNAAKGLIADLTERQGADERRQKSDVPRLGLEGLGALFLGVCEVTFCGSRESRFIAFSRLLQPEPGDACGERCFGFLRADSPKSGKDGLAVDLLVNELVTGTGNLIQVGI
jgi:hypothetical protein